MGTMKNFLTEAPVLKYYDVSKPVTVQRDASQSGLGEVLLQDDHPICYAFRALTDTEMRYMQIEKKCWPLCGPVTSLTNTCMDVIQ